MQQQEVVVYISSNSPRCSKLVDDLSEAAIVYQAKNVTDHPEYLDQLHEQGVFGTPVTYVDDDPVLGMQINKIKHKLGIADHYQSHRHFDGN
ncbi:hypothetical protein GCM10028778_25630 [Barrientosiimonas marina]|uniref:Glutaredoxin family protein n=1 Tax=Lentibacillus kimchii TaxID=1542911 RepID=A0ABW2UWE8_9BACI